MFTVAIVFLALCVLVGIFLFVKLATAKSSDEAKKYNKYGKICGILSIIGVIFLMVAMYTPSRSSNVPDSFGTGSNVTDSYGHDKFDAIVIAEKAVKGKLKSPSTAEFCSNSDYSVTCSGNAWTVRGYVDAQNSFGATLRQNFVVSFTFSSSSKYTVTSCSIG